MVSVGGGIGRVWGTLQELLHPRGKDGRFIRKNKIAPDIAESISKSLDAFRPRTFPSDQAASQFLTNIAKPGRFGGGSEIARFKADFEAVQEDLRDGVINNPSTRKYIAMMDASAINLPDDLIVSRTVSPSAFGLTPQNVDDPDHGIWGQVGNLVADRGYASTNVGHPIPGPPGSITIIHAAPKGTKAIIPSTSPNDREVLFDRDQEMRISKIQPDGRGGYNVFAVLTPRTPGETPPPMGGHVGAGTPAGQREERIAALRDAMNTRMKAESDQEAFRKEQERITATPPEQVPAGDAAVFPTTNPAAVQEHPQSRQPSQPGPAAPNVEQRQESTVSESVGTGSSPVGPPAAPAPVAPKAPAPQEQATAPAVPQPPGGDLNAFRAATQRLEAPTQGKQRAQFNAAYLGILQGKKHPDDILRELESDIANNEHIAKDHDTSGRLADAEQMRNNNHKLQQLADSIKSHFGLEGRQAAAPAPAKAAKAAKKTAPRKTAPKGPLEFHERPVQRTPEEQRVVDDAVIRRANSLPETPRNEEERRIKEHAASIEAARRGEAAPAAPRKVAKAPAKAAPEAPVKTPAKAPAKAPAPQREGGLAQGGVREQAVTGRKPTPDELNGMTVAELRKTAAAHGVTGTSKMRKEELRNHLTEQLHGGGAPSAPAKAKTEASVPSERTAPTKRVTAKAAKAEADKRDALDRIDQILKNAEGVEAFDSKEANQPSRLSAREVLENLRNSINSGEEKDPAGTLGRVLDSFAIRHSNRSPTGMAIYKAIFGKGGVLPEEGAAEPKVLSHEEAAKLSHEHQQRTHQAVTLRNIEGFIGNGASARAWLHSTEALKRNGASDASAAKLLEASRSGDPAKMRTALDESLHEAGLKRDTGWTGTIEKFDPKVHQGAKVGSELILKPGDPVEILRPGISGPGVNEKALVDVPSAPASPPKGPGEKGLQDLEGAKTIADLRRVAADNRIEIPKNVKLKAAIRQHIEDQLKPQGGESNAAHADRLGELKPGEFTGPRANEKITTPDRKKEFVNGWNKAAGSSASGSALRSNSEIRDGIANGDLTPAEGLKKLENEIAFNEDDFSEFQRDIRSGTVTGDDLAELRQRRNQLRNTIAGQKKLSKFMRDHFNKEEPITPQEVMKLNVPSATKNAIERATPDNIREAAKIGGLGELEGSTKEELLQSMFRKMAGRVLEERAAAKAAKAAVPAPGPNTPKVEDLASGLDIPEMTKALIQMDLENPKKSFPSIGRRIRDAANGPGSPGMKRAVAQATTPVNERTPQWQSDMDKLARQQSDMLKLAERFEKSKRGNFVPAEPKPALTPKEVTQATDISKQTSIPETQVKAGLEKVKREAAPPSDQAVGVAQLLSIVRSRNEAHDVLRRKTKPELLDIAKAADVSVTSRMTKQQIADTIVQHKVGHRLDSDALLRAKTGPGVPIEEATNVPLAAPGTPERSLQIAARGGFREESGGAVQPANVRFGLGNVTEQLGRTQGDEPLRPPNGGADQGALHMDSQIGHLWQDLASDKREPNSVINEIGDIGQDVGRGKITLIDAADRLERLQHKASDPAVKKRIGEAVDEISGPHDKPDLPDNVPPEARAWIDSLSQIPTLRRTDVQGMRTSRNEPSVYEQALDLVKRAAAGERVDTMEFRNIGHKVHEMVDGGYVAQRVTGKTWSSPSRELRQWTRGRPGGPTPPASSIEDVAKTGSQSAEAVMRRLGNTTIPELRQEAARLNIKDAASLGRSDLIEKIADKLTK